MSEEVSHGRGGAGNIKPDDTPYADASIVREGPVGDQGDGTYSAGRGGAGNIESPHIKPTHLDGERGDADIVPETAMREPQENYHIGRGGQGNVHKEKHHEETGEHHEGLGEKLKHKVLGHKEKE
ncbi:MAG: hypothetical protein Q9220_001271 [cf. Caloplaca sp. 1 TL-2023]